MLNLRLLVKKGTLINEDFYFFVAKSKYSPSSPSEQT